MKHSFESQLPAALRRKEREGAIRARQMAQQPITEYVFKGRIGDSLGLVEIQGENRRAWVTGRDNRLVFWQP